MRKLVVAVLVVGGLLVPAAHVVAAQKRPAPTVEHVVVAGETLWGIARRMDPQGDPRSAIDTVMRLNHLSSPSLQPGQTLLLPAG